MISYRDNRDNRDRKVSYIAHHHTPLMPVCTELANTRILPYFIKSLQLKKLSGVYKHQTLTCCLPV